MAAQLAPGVAPSPTVADAKTPAVVPTTNQGTPSSSTGESTATVTPGAPALAASPSLSQQSPPTAPVETNAGPLLPGLSASKVKVRKRAREDVPDGRAKQAKVRAPALLVFGLGNAGEEHAGERHNLGQRVLLLLAERQGASSAEVCEGAVGARSLQGGDRPWLLLPPQGHINESGPALRAALAALGQTSAQVLVLVDDVALPLGVLRLRAKGSSGGHNGLRSIEAEFGADYHRLKVGIGGERSKAHVVGEFTAEEEKQLGAVVERAAEAAKVWLTLGPEEMSKVFACVNRPDFCNLSLSQDTATGPPADPPAVDQNAEV